MSGNAAVERAPRARGRLPQRYGAIVVVGGGCYGSYYVRQLRRASGAGALAYERLLVIDRDSACRVAQEPAGSDAGRPRSELLGPPPEFIKSEWAAFFDEYFAAAADAPDAAASDAIVPSPLMPHLMYEWLLRRARERWPGRRVETRPLGREPSMPWQRADPGGTHYVSFAEWTCPVNCVEPALCPEIRGPRTWSMPRALGAYVAAERRRGRGLAGPVIFHCRHRAYGVGMFDTKEVLAADGVIADSAARGPAEILVGTVSHCHGVLNLLAVGP
jgi:hypothetical protein